MSFNDTAIKKAEASLKARKRKYPKFKPGMTVAEYVEGYYFANAMRWVPTSFGIQAGAYTDIHARVHLRTQVENFFAPLSENPQWAHDDTVVEETEGA